MKERRVRGYILREKIGSGGIGEVYRASQDIVRRDVAIKIISGEYANNLSFIRRFQFEAQTIARLEHPHIVPLYDYWRDQEGAFLVMRWVQGGNLRDALNRQGGWELARVVNVVSQVGEAVAFSHRRNVIHRDLKPENVLLDIEGNAYVTDYGIAIDLREKKFFEENISYGSPYYAAPEQFSEHVVTPQADVYSLGILIFELLTGKTPFAGDSTMEVLKQQFYVPLPPVTHYRPDVPQEVDHVIRRATEKDWQLRYDSVIELLHDLRNLSEVEGEEFERPLPPQQFIELSTKQLAVAYETRKLASESTPVDTVLLSAEVRNPYKGLQPFDEADSTDFFGREVEIGALIERLQTPLPRLVGVVGASGSGKSSLVRAGLFPVLRAGYVEGADEWFIADMTLTNDPVEALAEALLRVAVRAGDDLSAILCAGDDGLVRAAHYVLPSDGVLLLHVDQFERLFTLIDDAGVREQFLNLLVSAACSTEMAVYVVVTLRADCYDCLLAHPQFAEIMRASTYILQPMNNEQLADAIVQPARRVGVNLEPNLEKVIVADAGGQTNALPLLEYALTEMFEMRDHDNQLTYSAYEAVGGISGALVDHADELYGGLSLAQQRLARQLLLRLIVFDESRQPICRRVMVCGAMSALNGQDAQAVMDVLVQQRLLTYDRDPQTSQATVEIAHEALLTAWKPMQEWLVTSERALHVRQRIQTAAADWLQSGHDPSYLAVGARLTTFEQVLGDEWVCLSLDERRYIEASIQQRQRHEQQKQLTVIAISLSVLIVIVLAMLAMMR